MALLDIVKKKKKDLLNKSKRDPADDASADRPFAKTERRMNKDMFVDLLRVMKTHDLRGAIAIFSNTTDNINLATGIMINKGYISKKIISYMQEMKLRNVDEALRYVRSDKPDDFGFHTPNDKTAGLLNVPADVMLYGVESKINRDHGLILVFHKSVQNREELRSKISQVL